MHSQRIWSTHISRTQTAATETTHNINIHNTNTLKTGQDEVVDVSQLEEEQDSLSALTPSSQDILSASAVVHDMNQSESQPPMVGTQAIYN